MTDGERRAFAVKYQDFFRTKPRAIAPLYLFVCEDATRAEEGAAWLAAQAGRLWGEPPEVAWVSPGAPAEETPDGEAGGAPAGAPDLPARLSELLETPSLFSGGRMVWIRRAQAAWRDLEAFLDRWEKGPPPRAALGLCLARAPARPRGVMVEFPRLWSTPPAWKPEAAPWDNDLARWVAKFARGKHGKDLSVEDAHRLIERVGEDVDQLARALETLALYAGEAPDIAREAIEALVADRRAGDLGALVDAVARGNRAAAEEALAGIAARGAAFHAGRDALSPEEALIPAAAALAQFAWDAARAQEAAAGKRLAPEALAALGIASRPRQRAVTALLARCPPPDCARWLAALAALDRELKGGGGGAAGWARLEWTVAEMLP